MRLRILKWISDTRHYHPPTPLLQSLSLDQGQKENPEHQRLVGASLLFGMPLPVLMHQLQFTCHPVLRQVMLQSTYYWYKVIIFQYTVLQDESQHVFYKFSHLGIFKLVSCIKVFRRNIVYINIFLHVRKSKLIL